MDMPVEHLQETSEVWLFNHVSEPIRNHADMVKEIQRRVDAAEMLIMHNAKFDLAWLIHMGIDITETPVWCTMLGEYVLYGQRKDISKSLNACAARRKLGSKHDAMAEFWEQGYETDEIPWDIHNKYVRQDVHLTKHLFLEQYPQLLQAKLGTIAKISSELTKMLAQMEYDGTAFDAKEALAYADTYKVQIDKQTVLLKEVAGVDFNPGSAPQLNAVMFGGWIKRDVMELVARPLKGDRFKIYTRKGVSLERVNLGFKPHESTMSKKTLKYSTGAKARELLRPANEQQRLFLETLGDISKSQKVVSTICGGQNDLGEYETGLVTKVDSKGFIHPSFNQAVTITARLSSSNPNGQNLPRGSTSPIKKCIKSVLGYIVNVDLSQIEWRNAACLSRDKTMMDELWQDFDVHSDRARRSFGGETLDSHSKAFKAMRQASKTFNFRMIYGGTARAFFLDGKMPDFPLKKYEEIVQDFYDKYSRLREWQLENHELVKKQHYLRAVSGRILTFKYNTNPDDGAIGYSLQAVCNYPVQSFSADCMQLAMYIFYKKFTRLKKLLNLKTKIRLQVHDSLVFDCPEEEVYLISKVCSDVFTSIPDLVKQYFDFDMGIPIACEVSLGRTYGDLYDEVKSKDVSKETFNSIFLMYKIADAIKLCLTSAEEALPIVQLVA